MVARSVHTPVMAPTSAAAPRGSVLLTSTPVLLVRAAHPRQAVLTALALAAAAAISGRPLREVGMVALTVLVGQAVLGLGDDLADRERDVRRSQGKPLASGRLDTGTVWFALACAVLLVVPLSVFHGERAGAFYLGSLAVALVGDRILHATVLSFVPWAVSFGLYPAFLAHGGWNGIGTQAPPTLTMTLLAAALGVVVHVLVALPGLVDDHQEGERSLPLRLALRTGTPRLLVLAGVAASALVVALLVTGRTVGLT